MGFEITTVRQETAVSAGYKYIVLYSKITKTHTNSSGMCNRIARATGDSGHCRNLISLVILITSRLQYCDRATYVSMSETKNVKKLPLLLNFSDPTPPNRRPFLMRSTQTSLAISPKYMPEIIFSNLKPKKVILLPNIMTNIIYAVFNHHKYSWLLKLLSGIHTVGTDLRRNQFWFKLARGLSCRYSICSISLRGKFVIVIPKLCYGCISWVVNCIFYAKCLWPKMNFPCHSTSNN